MKAVAKAGLGIDINASTVVVSLHDAGYCAQRLFLRLDAVIFVERNVPKMFPTHKRRGQIPFLPSFLQP